MRLTETVSFVRLMSYLQSMISVVHNDRHQNWLTAETMNVDSSSVFGSLRKRLSGTQRNRRSTRWKGGSSERFRNQVDSPTGHPELFIEAWKAHVESPLEPDELPSSFEGSNRPHA
jgi:hypothetical protein